MNYIDVTMEKLIPLIIITALAVIAYSVRRKALISKRENLIKTYQFPSTIAQKVIERYPHLDPKEADRVIAGLREYFHLCNITGNRMVSMPSQAVDVAWHEFILFTKRYEFFCSRAFGHFLHHTPAEAMKSPTAAQKGIKTAWKISCYREKISPRGPHKLPLLFALDTDLEIPDGFKYSLNCSRPGSNTYCASHIGCSSGSGGGCSGGSSDGGGGCGGGGD